jgi:hypothetical protein
MPTIECEVPDTVAELCREWVQYLDSIVAGKVPTVALVIVFDLPSIPREHFCVALSPIAKAP